MNKLVVVLAVALPALGEDLKGVWMWPGVVRYAYGAYGTLNLTAAGNKAAQIFVAPETGSIDSISFTTQAVTTAGRLEASIQTVDAATNGDPTGTLRGAAGSVTVAAGVKDKYTATLGGAATTTAGEVLAVVIEAPTGEPTVATVSSLSATLTNGFPYSDLCSGASCSYAKRTHLMAAAVHYSSGHSYSVGASLVIDVLAANWTASSSPDEYSNRFVPAVTADATGVAFQPAGGASGPPQFTLYDADGYTPLRTVTWSTRHNSGVAMMFIPFSSPVRLNAGATYRIGVRATTTNVYAYQHTVKAASDWGDVEGGLAMYKSARTWVTVSSPTLSSAGTTVTASAAYFTDADIGSIIVAGGQQRKITGVGSGSPVTTCTVDQAFSPNLSGASWEKASAWTDTTTARISLGLLFNAISGGTGGSAWISVN